MSSDNKQYIRDLYFEIGFIFGGTTTFKNRMLLSVDDIDSCTLEDVEKIICEEISNGNFLKLFKQCMRNKGMVKAFDFFDKLFNKYNINLDKHQLHDLSRIVSKNFDDVTGTDLNNNLISSVAEILISESSIEEDDSYIDNDEEQTSYSSDPIKIYLKEIGKIPLLEDSEIMDIFNQIDSMKDDVDKLNKEKNNLSKDDENYNKKLSSIDEKIKLYNDEIKEKYNFIIEHNLRLVVSIAKKYVNRGLPLLELIQEGNVGLTKNVDRFDVKKGYKFSTYITWWIRSAITKAIKDQSKTIYIPAYVVDAINDIKKAMHKLRMKLYREPTVKEIAEEVGLDPEKVKEFLKASQDLVSLDKPVDNDDPDATLGDFVVDPNSESVEDYVTRKDEGKRMTAMIEELDTYQDKSSRHSPKLNNRRREIMELRYLGDEPLTLEEVGKKFDVTRERIRQIESKAIRIIHHKHAVEEDSSNLLPIYDENALSDKQKNYEIYCKYNDMHIKVLELHRPSGKFRLKCLDCGREWSVPIKELGPTSRCIKCDYEIMKKRNEPPKPIELGETDEHKSAISNEFKTRLIEVSKRIGVSILELHRALYRVNTDEIGILVKNYDAQMTPEEAEAFNNVVQKVKSLVEVDKKSDMARKRRKGKEL